MIAETGAVDIEGLRKLLRYHVERNRWYVFSERLGEASLLTMEERKLILTTAVEVKGRFPFLSVPEQSDRRQNFSHQQAMDLDATPMPS
jgi:dihydrodipicolinate synthase/N-acetylneuraminate lyase